MTSLVCASSGLCTFVYLTSRWRARAFLALRHRSQHSALESSVYSTCTTCLLDWLPWSIHFKLVHFMASFCWPFFSLLFKFPRELSCDFIPSHDLNAMKIPISLKLGSPTSARIIFWHPEPYSPCFTRISRGYLVGIFNVVCLQLNSWSSSFVCLQLNSWSSSFTCGNGPSDFRKWWNHFFSCSEQKSFGSSSAPLYISPHIKISLLLTAPPLSIFFYFNFLPDTLPSLLFLNNASDTLHLLLALLGKITSQVSLG